MLTQLIETLQQLTLFQGAGGLVLMILSLLVIGSGVDGRLTLIAVATTWFASGMLLFNVVPPVMVLIRLVMGVCIVGILIRVLWAHDYVRWFTWKRTSYVAITMAIVLVVSQFTKSYLPDSTLLYIATLMLVAVGVISIVSVTNRVLVGVGILLLLLCADIVVAALIDPALFTITTMGMAALQLLTAMLTVYFTANVYDPA